VDFSTPVAPKIVGYLLLMNSVFGPQTFVRAPPSPRAQRSRRETAR
jgi:hypothetical protein